MKTKTAIPIRKMGETPGLLDINPADKQHRVMDKIRTALQNPGLVKPHIMEFIYSTVSASSTSDLKVMLENWDDPEIDSIIDLIFFPDQVIAEALEPLLESCRFSKADEKKIVESLLAKPIRARIFLPDLDMPVIIRVPEFIIDQFVGRLNINWRHGNVLSEIINRRFSASDRLKIKVKLRSSHPALKDNTLRLLAQFLEKVEPGEKDLFPCLGFILTLVDDIPEDANLYDFLVERKWFYFRSLKKAEKFEKLSMKTNMETLMLQGIRAPHAPKEDLKNNMELIDTVCRIVFNKTKYFQTAREHHYQEVSVHGFGMNTVL